VEEEVLEEMEATLALQALTDTAAQEEQAICGLTVPDTAEAAEVQLLTQEEAVAQAAEVLVEAVTLFPQAEATALTDTAAEAVLEMAVAQAGQEELFFAIEYHRNF
jgi:hypothetical protein